MLVHNTPLVITCPARTELEEGQTLHELAQKRYQARIAFCAEATLRRWQPMRSSQTPGLFQPGLHQLQVASTL